MTEPQPRPDELCPQDVPADLIEMAFQAYLRAPKVPIDDISIWGYVLAAVVPAIRQAERDRIAEAILADLAAREQRSPEGRPIGPPATPVAVRILQERRKRAERDAEIARGGA